MNAVTDPVADLRRQVADLSAKVDELQHREDARDRAWALALGGKPAAPRHLHVAAGVTR